MAKASAPIFNPKAAEKLRSPDDLDKYIRVTNPSVWVVLAACIVLLAGLLAWGVFGAVTTSVEATGVSIAGQAMCFVSAGDAADIEAGDEATVGGARLTVAKVANVPVSREEADQILLSDYLTNTLVTGDWAYQVTFEGDTSGLAESVPLSVVITVDRIAPISLILGGGK